MQVPIFLQNTKKLVYVEVQFRTIAMDFWASLEHKLQYKKNIPESQAKLLRMSCMTVHSRVRRWINGCRISGMSLRRVRLRKRKNRISCRSFCGKTRVIRQTGSIRMMERREELYEDQRYFE